MSQVHVHLSLSIFDYTPPANDNQENLTLDITFLMLYYWYNSLGGGLKSYFNTPYPILSFKREWLSYFLFYLVLFSFTKLFLL